MAEIQILTVPIKGMDCAGCTQSVRHAISKLDGVKSVNVLLATEKAIIQLDPDKVTLPAIREAVAGAGGYSVSETPPLPTAFPIGDFNHELMILLTIVFGVVLLIILLGSWLV